MPNPAVMPLVLSSTRVAQGCEMWTFTPQTYD